MNIKNKANALINETSPYLLQHAYNPVHWYPWSEQALNLAKDENKPILLSIGYSACHWCHVMAHESFEDKEISAVMNKYFINIKVDREERPDLDRIYQTAQQLLTQRSGGWPLTMILSPDDHVPFFGGTYFPPQARFGLPGFIELLQRIAELYENEPKAINKQNLAVMEALQKVQMSSGVSPTELNLDPVTKGIQELSANFDKKFGGFGDAPKFPQTPTLEFLLHASQLSSNDVYKSSMDMVNLTLAKMATGGIYDHLGGGFSRYSVDQYWLIPHFEKMLYDNGPLLYTYSQAWHITDNEHYQHIAIETANWLIRDMQAPNGGYYSSLDADSEGEEGKFYVWTPDEIKTILNESEYNIFSEYYGLTGPANFEGHWHLNISAKLDQISSNIKIEDKIKILISAKDKLLNVRGQRVWPERDEKILTSWNALAIKGMSIASLRLKNESYLQSAINALTFIHESMWHEDRLYASHKDGKSNLNAYLDDYAYLIDAIMTILSIRWDTKWLNFAQDLSTVLLDQFYDNEHGGFLFTSHDHEKLLQRRRDFMDDATPSGNGIATRALITLGHLTGNQKFIHAGEQTLKAAWHSLENIPYAHSSLLQALTNVCYPSRQIIIRGKEDDISVWQNTCYEIADVNTAVYAIPGFDSDLPGLLSQAGSQDRTVAYICEGFVCKAPVTTLDQLISDLKR